MKLPTFPNPWKTVSSRIAYKNPWISIREDQVIRPDGKPGIYGVMEKGAAVGVVALTPDNKVYLVGQYRYATNHYSWEIIEGGAEPGENPLTAIKRELREEAGLEAETWEQLGPDFHLSNCITAEVGYLYLATNLHSVGASPEGTEQLEVRALPFSDCLEMVNTGEIKDSMTVIAVLRLAARGLK